MLRLTLLWRALAQLALGLFELDRIEQLSALVALITTCVVIVTLRTDTIHVAVRQESLTGATVQLAHRVLFQILVVIELEEYVLRNIRLLRRRRTSKVVKTNLEPFIHLGMQRMVLVTQRLRRDTLF